MTALESKQNYITDRHDGADPGLVPPVRSRRLMLAAMKSGSGKTTLTCGVLAALKQRGISLCAIKCGPDYIDPMFHREMLQVPTGNLDTFFTHPDTTRALLKRHENALNPGGLTLIEGVMGYFDGLGGVSTKGSSYELAAVTGTPVILIVDAKGTSVSLAAQIRGMLEYSASAAAPVRPKHNGICGILLNRVSTGFYPRLKSVIEESCGLPVVGYLPELSELRLPSRHLGLVSPAELNALAAWKEAVQRAVEETVDLEQLLSLAEASSRQAGKGQNGKKAAGEGQSEKELSRDKADSGTAPLRIGIARDHAFSFIYTENLWCLADQGITPVFFSPLKDTRLPSDLDGLWLPGGYPELYAKELSANVSMRRSIRQALSGGMPCIAECGGFLYLMDALQDAGGDPYRMCGVLRGEGYPAKGLRRFGYFEAVTKTGSLFGGAGTSLRGHEFHHWDTDAPGDGMTVTKPLRKEIHAAEVCTPTLIAGFLHFYLPSCPDAVRSFRDACQSFHAMRLSQGVWDQISHPLDGLGLLEKEIIKLCGIRQSPSVPSLEKRAAVIFCGDHGVVKEGVTQTGSEVTRILAEAFADKRAIVNRFADTVGADVYSIDVGMLGPRYPEKKLRMGTVVDKKVRCGTRNLLTEAAMTKEECLAAMEVGIETARSLRDMGYHILTAGEMGIGNTTASSILCALWLGLDPKEVTGRGAGLADPAFERKQSVVEQAAARIRSLENVLSDPVRVLAEGGGLEIAALTGLCLGAMRCRVPVILDGMIACTAALGACRIDPRVRGYLLASHVSSEPVCGKLLEALQLTPAIHADLHQGEGTGALLLLPMLDAAAAVYKEMGSFAAFGIPAYQRAEALC